MNTSSKRFPDLHNQLGINLPCNPRTELAATYSILAADPSSGEMGGAVQSHFFAVGKAVLWAEPGTGLIATQSIVNRQYGPDGLALLREGAAPQETLIRLTAADDGKNFRQAAVINRSGETAVHTGENCIREAGHRNGPCFSVQANMMLRPTVWNAMEEAFLSTGKKPLADRMLAALRAAEREGGDIRGKQAAAMVIVRTEATGRVDQDWVLDLRVEDHPDPVEELSRLIDLHRGYRLLEDGDTAMEQGKSEQAMDLYGKAENLITSNPEALYWHGIAFLNAGLTEQGLTLLKPLFRENPVWIELALRLPESGLASFNEETIVILRNLQCKTD